jgi:two-component system, OmpR family, KDP operon response regulator KdpE
MRILVTSGERAFWDEVRAPLEADGYEALKATSEEECLQVAAALDPDLVLLDCDVLGVPCTDLCSGVRDVTMAVIVVISERDADGAIISALNAGADDYLVKPLRLGELRARVKAHLRRRTASRQPEPGVFRDDTLCIELGVHRVDKRGERIYLSHTERRLLLALLRAHGQVVPAAELCERLWGATSPSHCRQLSQVVGNLRKKIEDDPKHPRYIHTLRGKGYRFGDADASSHRP